MTLVSEIISDAYRESNVTAIGTAPSSAQQDEGLRALNRIVSGVFGTEDGEDLEPLALGRNNITTPSGFPWWDLTQEQDWFVPLNKRLMLNLESPTTVYLHPQPQDGSRFGFNDLSGNLATNILTIKGNGRLIGTNGTVLANTNSQNDEYFYRDDLGEWLKYTPLVGTDTFPFPLDFDDFFILSLAMRLNPRNGASMDPQSIQAYKSQTVAFRARYRQVIQTRSEEGLIRTPGTRTERYYGGTPEFNAGYPYGTFGGLR